MDPHLSVRLYRVGVAAMPSILKSYRVPCHQGGGNVVSRVRACKSVTSN